MSTLFDLVNASAELKLKGPDGSELPVTLRIQGLNVASIKQKALEANVYIMQAGKADNADVLLKNLSRAERSAEEMASAAIVGWDNDEFMGGAYTPAYAKEIVSRPEMEFVRRQVNEFISEQSNFFRSKSPVVDGDTPVAA